MKKHSRPAHHEKITEHAKSLVAATSHITDSKVAEVRDKLSEVMESAKDAVEYVEDQAIEGAKQAGQYIREKPYHAVGLAVIAGTLIGFCVARRK